MRVTPPCSYVASTRPPPSSHASTASSSPRSTASTAASKQRKSALTIVGSPFVHFGGENARLVSVQGLWDRSITEWLAAKHGLPPSCVENRAAAMKGPGHAQKKEKKAANVRRA